MEDVQKQGPQFGIEHIRLTAKYVDDFVLLY